MSDFDFIIVPALSNNFNREAKQVKAVLAKYNAHFGKASGFDKEIIIGVQQKDLGDFTHEFRALPGVRSTMFILNSLLG